MGLESTLIGEEPKIQPLIQRKVRRKPEAFDIVCFGKMSMFSCIFPPLKPVFNQFC